MIIGMDTIPLKHLNEFGNHSNHSLILQQIVSVSLAVCSVDRTHSLTVSVIEETKPIKIFLLDVS